MGGGLMQLVAYGAQDIYLTGNPQITFFKVVYRRHTNFAVESIEQTFNGSASAGSKISVTVSRNGDLLSQVWISNTATVPSGETNVTGNTAEQAWAAIDNVEVEVGGQIVDKQYGHWMQVWTDLTHTSDQSAQLDNCLSSNDGAGTDKGNVSYLPLQFWFCRNPGLALPLIALQYHEVKLNVTFDSNARLGTVKVWCDYVFLDTDERRRFAQVSHEYLIEQVQSMTTGATDLSDKSVDLNFNHPVKELVFSTGDGSGATSDGIFAAGGTLQLKLNGHDRFAARDSRYFSRTQIWQHHSGAGGLVAGTAADGAFNDAVGVYSFALKPEEHQPSGTCNFSRIDNAQLVGTGTSRLTRIFAVNYNVLRIMSGMGGLAYSN